MLSHRKEPFRYTFEKPIDCLFEITEVSDHEVSSSKGEAQIVNLSPHGMKMISHLAIPRADDKSVHVSVSFTLIDKTITAEGTIVWINRRHNNYEYGIDLIENEEVEKEIIEQLKLYAKKINKIVEK